MKMEKKYIIISIVMVMILLLGGSYAYFKARIIGSPSDISLTGKEVYLKFNGSNTLVSGTIVPGWSETKTFTIENESKREETYNIIIEDLVNTFVTTGYLQYKITSDTGYNMSEYEDIPKSSTSTDRVLSYNTSIPASTIQNYTIELIYKDTTEDQSADMGKTLSGILVIDAGTLQPTLAEAILRDNPTVSERTQFDEALENNEKTIYKTNKTEDGSTVYYYSDDTTNNWVKFGKYDTDLVKYKGYYSSTNTNYFKYYLSLEECNNADSYNYNCTPYVYYNEGDDMYWRIIRTNEDGSIRLLYSGVGTNTDETSIGSSPFNEIAHESRYVGYMYGGNTSFADNRANTTSSTIKNYIDNWYQNNLLTNYDKYISKTAIYCNDRSISYGTWANQPSYFKFGIVTRVDSNTPYYPSYKCGADTSNGLFESTQAIEDKFSVSTAGGGNGQLTYPVALLTADELTFIGKYYTTPFIYDNGGGSFWTMTPYESYNAYGTSGIYALVSIAVGASICPMEECLANDSKPVRPVLSIYSCAKVTGTGTPEDPYVIDEVNSICS